MKNADGVNGGQSGDQTYCFVFFLGVSQYSHRITPFASGMPSLFAPHA